MFSKIKNRINNFRLRFYKSTSLYWEYRYATKGNSGSGSYGRLSEFKAEIFNKFVDDNKIKSILDLGCGDGNQISLFKMDNYFGLDVSKTIIKSNQKRFKNDKTKTFLIYNNKNIDYFKKNKVELCISFDVLFHLVENDIFITYLNNLFNTSTKYVLIYSSNQYLNISPYEFHRPILSVIEKNFKEWELFDVINNKYPYDEQDSDETSLSNFYFFRKIR